MEGQDFSDPMDKLPRCGIVLFISHLCSCTKHVFPVYSPCYLPWPTRVLRSLLGVPLPGVGCMTLMLLCFLIPRKPDLLCPVPFPFPLRSPSQKGLLLLQLRVPCAHSLGFDHSRPCPQLLASSQTSFANPLLRESSTT